MKVLELPLARIGNSKGIRLPATLLKRYGITDSLLLEQRADEIVLKPKRSRKLSWKETFEAMAKANEDWSDFDGTADDGLRED